MKRKISQLQHLGVISPDEENFLVRRICSVATNQTE